MRAIFLLLLLVTPVCADDVLLRKLDPGKAYAVQQVNGKWVVTVIDAVVGGPAVVNPPLDPKTLAGKVQLWTAEINANPTTTKALVESNVRLLQKGVSDGSVAFSDVFAGKKLFTQVYDTILEKQGEKAQWVPLRTKLTAELVRLTQDKKLDQKDEVLSVLQDISNGHQGYLNSSGFLDRIDLDKIIRLVNLLSKFFPEASIVTAVLEILKEIKQ